MEFDLLINIFDLHNEASILLTEKYKPKNVLFFYMTGLEIIQLEKLKIYYKEKFPMCKFDYKKLDINSPREIESAINSYENMKGVCNLTSGKKLATLMIYTFCIKHNIICKYVDVKNEVLIDIGTDEITLNKNSFIDLEIEDIIKSIGASIIIDSTTLYSNKVLIDFTMWISQNIEKWDELKMMLQDTTIFLRDEDNMNFLNVDNSKIPSKYKEALNERLDFLEENKQISILRKSDFCEINFLNDFIKTFLFKSGTWLEILTQKIVEEIDVIDEVKSGLLFLWDNDKSNVRNELDIVAIKDSVMICISCKDSKKYDEVTLNELNVYAGQLGGENVIKILVATKEPSKTTILQRAKEMGIELIIFNGDINKFKRELTEIINQKRETS